MSAAGHAFRTHPEAAVVLAAQAGNRDAFSELVRRRESWLRALLRRLTGSTAEADDLAQEAFLRAWRRLHSLKHPAAFGSWLRLSAVRLYLDTRRLPRAQMEETSSDLPPEAQSEDVSPDRAAGARIELERAMQMLSAPERLCVTLNLGEGLSHGEVAEATGLPLGTVKSHILRATTRLRRYLGESDE